MKTEIQCAFCGASISTEEKHSCLTLLDESFSKGSSSSSNKRSKLTTSLEELFDPLCVSKEDINEEPAVQVVDKKVVVNQAQTDSDSLECPVCLKGGFSKENIEQHVNDCLQEPELAVPQEASAPSMSDDEEDDDNNNYMKDQDRHFQLWLKRRAQEEEDRRVAEQLLQQGKQAPKAAPAAEDPDAESERLARELQAEEERRANAAERNDDEAASLRLARQLQAAEEAASAEAEKAAQEASERVARELQRKEEEEERREKEKEARAAADAASLRVAEAAMLAEERQKLEYERRIAADEALARRLDEEERTEEARLKLANEVAQARREAARQAEREARAREARLQREKEALEAQLDAVRFGHAGVVSLPGVVYPAFWSEMAPGENQRLVNLHRGCREWQTVLRQFRHGAPNARVRQIVRNQNKSLWMWFYLARDRIGKKNFGELNERLLFHGSRTDATLTIAKEGFDHRVANLNGMLGAGNYFATSSSTSLGYLPRSRHNNMKCMLVCRVVLGKVGRGSQGLRRAPQEGHGVRCDSVSDRQKSMFCVFNDEQCFPEYLIYFD